MVKVSQHQAAANREALVAAAGRLLRRKGIDGVGVAELCEAAGLTHGALYSRFGSKNELIAEAFMQGQGASQARLRAATDGSSELSLVLDCYLSERQRDNMEQCCPMLASASEASRQDRSFRRNFAIAFEEFSKLIKSVPKGAERPDDDTAMVIAASMIGVMAVARALKAPNPDRSDKLLRAARKSLASLAKPRTEASSKRKRTRASPV